MSLISAGRAVSRTVAESSQANLVVYDQLKLVRLHHRQVHDLGALEDAPSMRLT